LDKRTARQCIKEKRKEEERREEKIQVAERMMRCIVTFPSLFLSLLFSPALTPSAYAGK
jgi:hypothetical protein